MEDAYIIEGVLGGYVTSGRKQGTNAARLLLAHQHGTPLADLPPILKSPNEWIFDDRALQQHGIDLPGNLRAWAVLLHPRPTPYDRFRSLILGVLIVLAGAFLLVVTVSITALSRKNRDLIRAGTAAEAANVRFHQLAEQSRTWHWEVDAEGLYTYISDVSGEVIGYRPEELVGKKHFYDLHPEEGRETFKGGAFKAFALRQPFRNFENIVETRDGRHVWMSTNGIPSLDSKGHLLGYLGSDTDITERKQTEEALRESEQRFRAITSTASDAILLMDDKGKIVYWNPAGERIFGYTEQEAIGKDLHLLLAPQRLHASYQKGFAGFVQTGQGPVVNRTIETMAINKAGGEFPIEISTSAMNIKERWHALGIIRDITERKRTEDEKRGLEERLNRAEKMEALGVLAGGVAHDLNNVLGVVVGYSELLLLKTEVSNTVRSYISKILKGGERAAAIVQDLLTLARRGVSGKDVVNLNQIVADFQELPEYENLVSYHPSVEIQAVLEPDLPNISGSSVHLAKSLFNLVSNGCEAMPQGGILSIRTTDQYLDKPIQGYDEVREGEYVSLSVSDSGEGISETDLKRVFEPFYTKKIMGRSGTGLGLAVVWGTVKDHAGYVNVQSEEGKGSTFTLYFPVTKDETTDIGMIISPSQYMGKGETILIVDDVKGQRELATEMLRKLNYRITSVDSGEEAVLHLKEHPCDLLILDMIMDPGMDGLDTYKKVLEISPGQKAIIVSGFSESGRVHAAQALGAGAYVRKPYVIEKLGLAVRRELDRIP